MSWLELEVDNGLTLRLLAARDAEPLFALVEQNREHLRPWLPWVETSRSLATSRAFVVTAIAQLAHGNGFQAGLWHHGELAGMVGLHGIDKSRASTSIGYWLGLPYTGKGLMTRAVAAVIDRLFTGDLPLRRVEIRCAVGNTKSRAIPERLGFTLEGTLPEAELVAGRRHDLAVYAMLAPQWRSRGPAGGQK